MKKPKKKNKPKPIPVSSLIVDYGLKRVIMPYRFSLENCYDAKVAEMIITKEIKTNGLIEDLEIVVQLIIDQASLKLKIISKKGISVVRQVVDLFNKGEKKNNMKLFNRIYMGINQFMVNLISVKSV